MQRDQLPAGGSIFWMLIAALLFGYFGFVINWIETDADDNRIWIVSTFKWTLQAVCIGAIASLAINFLHRWFAAVLFSIIGIGSAIMFVVVIVWALTTDAPAPISPLLIAVLALVNGFSGWNELRELLAMMPRTSPSSHSGISP